MKTSKVLVLVLAVAVVSVIATLHFTGIGSWVDDKTAPKVSDPFDIEFAVDANEDKLEITEAKCTGSDSRPWSKGCLNVARGNSGVILFKFSFDEESPWKLTKFSICRGSEKEKLKCDLNVWERMEFAVANAVLNDKGKYEPGSTLTHTLVDGSIDLGSIPADSDSARFYLLDVNTIRKNYFYNIEACNGDKCISIDPPLKNKGRR